MERLWEICPNQFSGTHCIHEFFQTVYVEFEILQDHLLTQIKPTVAIVPSTLKGMSYQLTQNIKGTLEVRILHALLSQDIDMFIDSLSSAGRRVNYSHSR